jgi:hypothetical protein
MYEANKSRTCFTGSALMDMFPYFDFAQYGSAEGVCNAPHTCHPAGAGVGGLSLEAI